jgi:hypothetical protein
VSLGGILVIKTRDLGKVFGMVARLYKTINHMIRGHIIGATHEDGAETDGVNEVVVKFKDVLGIGLAMKVHDEDDWLINVARMGVADNGKKDFKAIVCGGGLFGGLRAGGEDAGTS